MNLYKASRGTIDPIWLAAYDMSNAVSLLRDEVGAVRAEEHEIKKMGNLCMKDS